MKTRYIELMAKTLTAYPDGHIRAYFDEVKREGLTEHGFPRLTANLGILISHGIRQDLLPLFCDMMEFCCQTIPTVKAANDFSVKEIIFCILELEKHNILPAADTNRWRGYLSTICPETCYNKFAKDEGEIIFNWALFTALSEYMRISSGIGGSEDFLETQLATQLRQLDENGMYRDALCHPPVMYDLGPRGLFSLLLHLGYRGKHYQKIDDALKKAGLLTLDMQSVTGEIPFGGRSNQFLHNEAHLAIIFEYEANRYFREGDLETAKRFKGRVHLALDNIALWLGETPISHIKNRFPVESKYGCEGYAYFDKYMITAASFLYAASLICNDEIPADLSPDLSPAVLHTSPWFHKVFVKCGGYALEFDTDADPHYDAAGLGRVHKSGAPSALCLSTPCTATPSYTVDLPKTMPLSLAPGLLINGSHVFATDGQKTPYRLLSLSKTDGTAEATLACDFADLGTVTAAYTVDESGVMVKVERNAVGEVLYLLPALEFDGKEQTKIIQTEHTLEIFYRGWVCRYTADGTISPLKKPACNRNGHYKAFFAKGQKALEIKLEMFRDGEK